MFMRDQYYQDLTEQYLREGDKALERFRVELSFLQESRKSFFVTRGKPRSRWKEYDGEREGVLISFLADQEALKKQALAEKSALKKGSKKATDAKYAPGRDIYRVALDIADKLWRKGDKRKHDKMLEYLVGKEGTLPQTEKRFHYLGNFDAACGYTRTGLRNKLKELAYEIDNSLVCGLKNDLSQVPPARKG